VRPSLKLQNCSVMFSHGGQASFRCYLNVDYRVQEACHLDNIAIGVAVREVRTTVVISVVIASIVCWGCHSGWWTVKPVVIAQRPLRVGVG